MASRSKPSSRPSGSARPAEREQRLQKVLAAAGISSRRDCEELIREGRVEVDRQVVTELGCRVDPARQEIRVDGSVLPKAKLVHFVLNKPAGVVSTNRDPAGRPRVVDLVPSEQRLFPVGRLDRSSEGLIIVTNDGELANLLTHPRFGVEKKYAVRVAGQLTPETIRQLRKGVYLAEGIARVSSVEIKRRHKQSTDVEIVLNEGRNREIRRVLARVGHKVLKLTRIAIGPLRLGELPSGAYRRLTPQELRDLLRTARDAHKAGGESGSETRPRGSRQRLAKLKSAPTGRKPASSPPGTRKRAARSSQPESRPPQGSILTYDDGDSISAKDQGKSASQQESGAQPPAPRPPYRAKPSAPTKSGRRPPAKGRKDAPAKGRSIPPAKFRRKKGT